LFEVMQTVLPSNRRRRSIAAAAARTPWFVGVYNGWTAKPKTPPPVAEPAEPPVVVIQQPAEVVVAEVLARSDMSELLAEFGRRMDALAAGIRAIPVATPVTTSQPNPPQPQRTITVQPPKPTKWRIGISGALPDQFQHIKEKSGGDKPDADFELRMLSRSPAECNLPQILDYVIVLHFNSHATTDTLSRSGVGWKFVHGVSGAVSGVHDARAQLIQKSMRRG
jgi:hypothetical protein